MSDAGRPRVISPGNPLLPNRGTALKPAWCDTTLPETARYAPDSLRSGRGVRTKKGPSPTRSWVTRTSRSGPA